jgi:hypothetical protein
MSQTIDFDLSNQPGNTFRAELNNDLQALATGNSGTVEPGTGGTTSYPYMVWIDTNTSPALLKQRNGANNAWITIGYVGTTAKVALFANNTEIVTVDGPNSRVGINDTTPSYALDVTGDINCTGALRIGGTSIGNIASNVTIDQFSGNGSTTGFTLSQAPTSINNVQVFVSGVYQPTSSFSIVGTTLTFGTAPLTGSNNIQIITGGNLVLGTPSDGTVTRAKMAVGGVARVNQTATKTTTYTTTNADDTVPCDATSGVFTVNVHTAAGNTGERITIKKIDSTFNIVTVDFNSSETGDGRTTIKLSTQYEAVTLESNGTNWYVLDRYIKSEWAAYTPTITHSSGAATNFTATGFWRRVGDNIEMRGQMLFSGTSSSFTDIVASLPSGLTIDAAKLPSQSFQPVGYGATRDAGVGVNQCISFYNTSSTIVLLATNVGSTYTSASQITQAVPFTFGNTDYIQWFAEVPITNWEG